MGKHSTALALCCGLVFALGCAQGTDTTTGDDAITNPDAQDTQHIDANPLPIDAHLPIDANIPIDASLPIDAASGLADGSSCTASAQCMSACCVIGFDACLPDPGIPGDCQ